ncbi:sec-independent protein translocase protein TatA [Sphingomonas laterariae]|uniref:Sec-independent protein translocase protein TatA n=1 Tax=Edaphosphingomonas laterariae TaxID=861865 RepID=A0A239CJB7_9SPHN|nr:twin-arginine translocase TatA/TatE family subunit [Sphingomonas laterariae]SNS19453.1 sec-independent protein translocase protein TatA [Sphingomonas laterariae]
MGGLSIWHWLVVGIIVLLLFGKGRFSDMMGDVAKGIKSFKKGMSEEEEAAKPAPRLQAQPPLEPNADRNLQPMQDDRPQQ